MAFSAHFPQTLWKQWVHFLPSLGLHLCSPAQPRHRIAPCLGVRREGQLSPLLQGSSNGTEVLALNVPSNAVVNLQPLIALVQGTPKHISIYGLDHKVFQLPHVSQGKGLQQHCIWNALGSTSQTRICEVPQQMRASWNSLPSFPLCPLFLLLNNFL
jgi:hypothetical protein